MPRRHSLSIYARLLGKKRTLMYIPREKGDRYYIQRRHNDLFFSHYNLFLGKRKEKLARKARVNTDASTWDRAYTPWASHNTLYIRLIPFGRRICKKVYWDARARAREKEGGKETLALLARPKSPFTSLSKGRKNRIRFSVVVAYSSAYTRKTCHLFFISHTFYLAYLWSSSLHQHWRLWSWYQYSEKCEWLSFLIWVCPA